MNRMAASSADLTGSVNNRIPLNRANLKLPLDLQRAEFLRSCRARIQPEDLGLPAPQRRRTAGLRREDVAALSGVSVAWYTWLEQGREMRVSDEVLERISRTFRLSENERSYLFSLVQHRPPRVLHDDRAKVPPEVAHLVTELPWPAIVMNLRWDVLAWNRLNSLVFRDYSLLPEDGRNLVELLFNQPSQQRDPDAAENMAHRILSKLRVDYSALGEDPKFESMIRRLESVSPTFRRLWRTPDIIVGSYGINRFTHASYGELAFEHTSYVPDGHPKLRIVLCRPADEATRRVVEQLNKDADPA
jgi:transcriptional regulator with XRE-family HTH domain